MALAHPHLPVLLLVLPVVSTVAGGLLALRFRRFLPLLMALGAGLLLGAAFLDLLPEALDLGRSQGMQTAAVLGLTLVFFLGFMAVEGLLDEHARPTNPARANDAGRRVGGGMMIFHSFRDGMAMGAAFSASHAAGYAVALGIVAHDLGDGMNTVLLTTGGGEPRRADLLFLLADALAPFAGGLMTLWWLVSSREAVVLLALAAGFFLQMATGDLLPKLRGSLRGGPPASLLGGLGEVLGDGRPAGKGQRLMLLAAVLGGSGLIYLANRLMQLR